MPKIIVHHLEKSRSFRVLWMLEELGLDYEVKPYRRNPKTWRAPAEYAALHPLGKAPVVSIDDLVIAESGAILEHLAESFDGGRLRPTDPELLRRYRYWLHYSEGSFAPILLVALIADRIKKAPVPFFLKPVVGRIGAQVHAGYPKVELERHLPYIDGALADGGWIAGPEFSAADVQLAVTLESARQYGADDHPRIADYLGRIRERPAHARAREREAAVLA